MIKASMIMTAILAVASAAMISPKTNEVIDYAKENNLEFVYYPEDDSEYFDVDNYTLVKDENGIVEYYVFESEDEAVRFEEQVVSDFSDNAYVSLTEDGLFKNAEQGSYMRIIQDGNEVLYFYSTDLDELNNTYENLK